MTRTALLPIAVAVAVAAGAMTGCSASPVSTPITPTGSATGTTSAGAPTSAPLPVTASGLQQDYVNVVARVLPSVVQITTDSGLGSGVVLDAAGDIVTNAHVVGTATTFHVQLANHPTPLPATLIGADGASRKCPDLLSESAQLRAGLRLPVAGVGLQGAGPC